MINTLTKSPIKVFITLYLFATTIFVAHYYIAGNAVWGDGRYYYAFVRSWVIDQDIDFSNERLVDPFYFDNIPTPIGRVGNKYSIGTPLIWFPTFLFAHLISFLGQIFNILTADGYGHLYRIFIGIDSVAYAISGLYLSYLVARKFTPRKPALLATVTIALGSHFFYYLAVDPINSHPPSIFIASFLIYYWHTLSRHHIKSIHPIILGLLTGFLAMIRNHDIIFALPIIYWLTINSSPLKTRLHHLTFFVIGIVVGFTPQLITWIRLYGSIISPYFLLGEGFNLKKAQIIPVLTSSNNGLFFYAPILLLSIFGLWKSVTQKNSFAIYGLSIFILQTIIIASWSGWWGGESFGGRMFLSLTPFFIIGLAKTYSNFKITHIYIITIVSIIVTQTSILRFLLTH